MEKIESYKGLIAYQKGYKLSLKIYEITRNYSKEEIYGLVSQMRRSAVSIPCNVAEGYRRGHRKEYVQFLYMAQGSCGELETLISLSYDLGIFDKNTFEKLNQMQEDVSKLLRGLIASLLSKTAEGE